MTVSAVFQVHVPPAAEQSWREIARRVKQIAEYNGGNPQWFVPLAGGEPNVVSRVMQFQDLSAFAAFNATMANDQQMLNLMPAITSSGTTVVATALNRELTGEIDALPADVQPPEVVQVATLQIAAGKRDAWMGMVRDVRAKARELGLRLSRIREPLVGGTPGTVTLAWAHSSLTDWAAERQRALDSGFPAANAQIAAAHGYPVTPLGSVLARNITSTL